MKDQIVLRPGTAEDKSNLKSQKANLFFQEGGNSKTLCQAPINSDTVFLLVPQHTYIFRFSLDIFQLKWKLPPGKESPKSLNTQQSSACGINCFPVKQTLMSSVTTGKNLLPHPGDIVTLIFISLKNTQTWLFQACSLSKPFYILPLISSSSCSCYFLIEQKCMGKTSTPSQSTVCSPGDVPSEQVMFSCTRKMLCLHPHFTPAVESSLPAGAVRKGHWCGWLYSGAGTTWVTFLLAAVFCIQGISRLVSSKF